MSDGTLIARFTQLLAFSASPRHGGVTSNYAAGIPQFVLQYAILRPLIVRIRPLLAYVLHLRIQLSLKLASS